MENYNSKDLYIKFYHGDIKNLSDGTLRKLLREFSKLTHEILLDEIDLILSKVDLPSAQKQSLRDIVKKETSGKANFYVEQIEKGSLTVLAIITGVTVVVLQNTLGKSVERSWKDSEPGKDTDKLMLKTFNTIYKHIKERPKQIIKKLLPKLKRKTLGQRFEIKEIKQDADKTKNLVTITVVTIDKEIAKKEETKIDNEYLEFTMVEEIKKIENKIKKNRKKK